MNTDHPLLKHLGTKFLTTSDVELLLRSKSYAGRKPPSIVIDYSSQWIVVYQTAEHSRTTDIKDSPVWKEIEAFYGKAMEPSESGQRIAIRRTPTWTSETCGHHWNLCPGNWWAFVIRD
jgi:hypothetical protein